MVKGGLGNPEEWQAWAKRAARLSFETFYQHRLPTMVEKGEWARGNPTLLFQLAMGVWAYAAEKFTHKAYIDYLCNEFTPLKMPFPDPDKDFLAGLEVAIVGDSSAYMRSSKKSRNWKSDLEYALTDSAGKKWAKMSWTAISGGEITHLIAAIQNILAARGNPEAINMVILVSWFLNEAFTQAHKLKPGIPQNMDENCEILAGLLRRFRYSAIIVGGSSGQWNVDSRFNDMVRTCKGIFLEHGIIVDDREHVWSSARLHKDEWHLDWEYNNRKVMAG